MKFPLLAIFLVFGAFSVFSQEGPRQAGIRYYRDGQYDRSIEYLTKAVTADKKDHSAWLYLGASHLKIGNKKEARKAFSRISSREKPDDGPVETEFKIISKGRATYTEEARRNGITGTVRLMVEFRSDGKIGFVFPYQVLSGGLTEICVDAANRIQFTPAVANGAPVTVLRSVEYSFDIY